MAMLTTIDNPYDPFEKFDDWYAFDLMKGYNTCGLLGRIAQTSNELSEADNELAIDQAMDEIVRMDPTCKYIKVKKVS